MDFNGYKRLSLVSGWFLMAPSCYLRFIDGFEGNERL